MLDLGPHRLVCGDARDPDIRALARARLGVVGALVFDPPYERRDLVEAFDIAGTGAPDVFVFGSCLHDTARRAPVPHPWRFGFAWDGVQRWCAPGRPLLAHKTCDWFSASGDYDHDAVRGADGERLASVYRAPITAVARGADHAKPPHWLAFVLGCASRGGVFDPFAGRGASLVACEWVGRPWGGIEQDPARCDVTAARWRALIA